MEEVNQPPGMWVKKVCYQLGKLAVIQPPGMQAKKTCRHFGRAAVEAEEYQPPDMRAKKTCYCLRMAAEAAEAAHLPGGVKNQPLLVAPVGDKTLLPVRLLVGGLAASIHSYRRKHCSTH